MPGHIVYESISVENYGMGSVGRLPLVSESSGLVPGRIRAMPLRYMAALGAGVVFAIAAAPSMAFAANPSSGIPPTIPQPASATSGASWLSSQLSPEGYIPLSGDPSEADLSATANTVLALASVGDDAAANQALDYMSGNVNSYVTVDGSDDPDELALLILDAHALGVNPTTFGGTNLVSRLLATQQTTGSEIGLFGSQDATYDGAYRQGLSLAALAAVGDTSSNTSQVPSAINWLQSQQCPDGGWTSLITSLNPCNGDPADYEGPDTNSTALAIQGLSAQEALTSKAARLAARFISSAEDADGGWGFEPNAADAPGSTDPDSTALVMQSILSLGKSPSSGIYRRGSSNPVSALMSFQLTSGTGIGAFTYPGESGPNTIATYQAVPAASGVTDPFNLKVTNTSLPSAVVGSRYSTELTASGGNSPYTWKLIPGSGALPTGLKLHSGSGVISGKPSVSGTSSFAIEVFGAKVGKTQAIAWKELSITTSPA
jgi:hypothetical protein